MKYLLILCLCCITLVKSQSAYPAGRSSQNERLEARLGEYPYQVSIQVDGRHICGGTLISKKHVLTAAHCTNNWIRTKMDKSRITVVVGTNNLNNGGTVMRVSRVSQHGNFGSQSATSAILVNDIAVIRLTQDVTVSSTVRPIGLPSAGQQIADGTRLIVTGYGATYTGGPTSFVLRHLYMYVTNLQTCATNWSNRGSITTGHICASLYPGYGACSGDSGGPLVLDDKSTVVGIVSQGIGLGCESGWPDLYTRVSEYLTYINSELALTN